jgi:hypothetical protein
VGTRGALAIFLSLASLGVALPSAGEEHAAGPPAPVPAALAKRIDQAIRAANERLLMALAARDPEAFDCRRVDWSWALGDAYARAGRAREARALAERLVVRACSDEQRLVTLYKARQWLPPADWEKLIAREAPLPRSAAVDEKLRRLDYDRRLERFYAAQKAGDAEAPQLFERVAAEVDRRRDAAAALAAAWLYYNGQRIGAAKDWFGRALQWRADSADARYGLALCAAKQGGYDEALQSASALPAGYPDRERLVQEAQLGKARAAHAAKRYDEAAALLREAGAQRPLPRYGRSLYGWNLLQLGDAEAAAAVFEQLHREQPDAESAQGRTLARQQRTQRMLEQKRFLAAARKDPELASSLGASGVAQLGASAAWRKKSGSEGTSRLRARLASLEGGIPLGASGDAFVRVDRVSLDSSALPANALVGSGGPGAYAFAPITEVEGIQPQLFARFERDTVWQLSLGLTPSGGPLAQHAFGRAERRAFTGWGLYDVAAFAEPVRESILSYAGLRDPYGGSAWGRVLRYGGEARALWLLPRSDWAVSAGARAATLRGESVADNDFVHADAGVGRNLGLRGFNYAVLGLETGFDRYRRNLSQFTLGQGGYYSPQRVLRGGVALNFLTEEQRGWIIRGRAAAGRVYRVQDDSPRFPLAPDGSSFAGSRDYGNDASIELSGIWQVAGQLQAGFVLGRSAAPQYNNTTGALVLRLLLEPRSALTSADLPARREATW